MKGKNRLVSRRHFLLTAATAAIAGPLILRPSAKAASSVGKLNHACIGVGDGNQGIYLWSVLY